MKLDYLSLFHNYLDINLSYLSFQKSGLNIFAFIHSRVSLLINLKYIYQNLLYFRHTTSLLLKHKIPHCSVKSLYILVKEKAYICVVSKVNLTVLLF